MTGVGVAGPQPISKLITYSSSVIQRFIFRATSVRETVPTTLPKKNALVCTMLHCSSFHTVTDLRKYILFEVCTCV